MSEDQKVTETNTAERNRRKERIGYVVSDKMQKTIVVELEDRKRHALYGKIIRTTSKVKAHDEKGDAASATACGSWRPARCPRPSTGVSSRCWRRPSKSRLHTTSQSAMARPFPGAGHCRRYVAVCRRQKRLDPPDDMVRRVGDRCAAIHPERWPVTSSTVAVSGRPPPLTHSE